MKKLYTLFTAVVLGSLGMSAQIVGTANGDLTIEGSVAVPENSELKTHFDIVNTSGQPLTLKVYRSLEDVVGGTTNKFCWGGVCYDLNTNTSVLSNTLDPGEVITADNLYAFTGYYYHNSYEGCSQINYCFYDVNNEELETCIEVRYAVDAECVVGLNEKEAEINLSGANPVSSSFALNYDLGRFAGRNNFVVIRSFTGAMVKEIRLNSAQGALFMDAAEFNSGIYFYSIVSDGQIVSTKKLVVSR
jgi:hypothetical protein